VQDVLDSSAAQPVQLLTVDAIMKEIAQTHAMRSAGMHDFDAAKPTDLIQLLLGQSKAPSLSITEPVTLPDHKWLWGYFEGPSKSEHLGNTALCPLPSSFARHQGPGRLLY